MPQVTIGVAIAISAAMSAGSAALQYALAPRPPKPAPIDKGKLDDIRMQGSDYGSVILRGWGRFRTAGHVVVGSPVVTHIVTTPGSGGKKNPTPTTHEYTYTRSVAIIVCHSSNVEQFLRVWQDSTVMVSNAVILPPGWARLEAEDGTLTGGASIEADPTASGDQYIGNLGNGGKVVIDTTSITDPVEPPTNPGETAVPRTHVTFYYKCATTLTATVDTDTSTPLTVEFPASAEWTVKTVVFLNFAGSVSLENASGDAPDLDLIAVAKSWIIQGERPVTGIVNPDIAYPPDINDPSEYYNYPLQLTLDEGTETYSLETPIPGQVIRLYRGSETQVQDPAIIAYLDGRFGPGEGDLRASAMRGMAYMVVQDLVLTSNILPNFTFEMEAGAATVNNILGDLFADVHLETSDYNVTATNGDNYAQTGFLDTSGNSRRSLVDFLARYHQFRIAEIDGKITTIADTFTPVAVIDEDSLRAHVSGEEMPGFDAEIQVKEEILLPREVRVSVMNPALDYHNEALPAQLFADLSGNESKEYVFPIVDTPANARTVAEKILLKEHSESKPFEVWVMPNCAKYSPGDVVTLPVNGQTYNVRIEKVQMTLPMGKIRWQCVAVNPFVPSHYQDAVTRMATKAYEQHVLQPFPRNSDIFVIQSEPIREADKGKLGVYLAVSGRGHGYGTQAALYRETAEDNFEIQGPPRSSSVLGICEDTLATHSIATEDTTNVLDIWFFDDIDLEAVTQDDIDRNPLVNLIRVGDEWLQFRTPTAQTLEDDSPYRSKWRVEDLWRGKFGTAGAVSSHAAGEYAALVTPNLQFYELEPSDVGETVNLKAVTVGQSVELAPVTSFVFEGNEDTREIEVLFNHFIDATTSGTSEETLYIDQIDSLTLYTAGDTISAEYSGIFASNVNDKAIKFTFGGTTIFNSGTMVENGAHWKANVTLIRVSNTTVKATVYFATENPWTPVYTQITGLNLTTTDYDLELKATTEAAGDLTAKMGYGLFIPSALTNISDVLMDESEDIWQDEGGDELYDG